MARSISTIRRRIDWLSVATWIGVVLFLVVTWGLAYLYLGGGR